MRPIKEGYARTIATVVAVVIVAGIAYSLFSPSRPRAQEGGSPGADARAPKKDEAPSSSESHVVQRVVDGDTLTLENGTKVRLIGVDTPETGHPEVPVQRFGREATEFTRRMAEGLEVRLEFEGERQDAYGRLLAYVFVDDTLLNREIIRRGYGYAMTRFPHSRMKDFLAAEREARAKQYGLWNYSLTDGRITNLADRYERLSPQGKAEVEKVWDELLEKYPAADTERGRDDGE